MQKLENRKRIRKLGDQSRCPISFLKKYSERKNITRGRKLLKKHFEIVSQLNKVTSKWKNSQNAPHNACASIPIVRKP